MMRRKMPKVLTVASRKRMRMLEEHCDVKVFGTEGFFPRDVLLRKSME